MKESKGCAHKHAAEGPYKPDYHWMEARQAVHTNKGQSPPRSRALHTDTCIQMGCIKQHLARTRHHLQKNLH